MTERPPGRLLPPRASPFERAMLQAMIEAWPLDVAAIRRQSDPMLCDAALLPFLACDKGLTLWSDAWPEIKKRRYVRDGWIYKRLEGTPLGVELYLNLADGALIEEILPPNRSFAIPDDGLTHQQVLDLMPQLRLYHHAPPHIPIRGTAFADVSFADDCFAIPDPGRIFGRYPVLFDPVTGIETPLSIADVDQTARTVTLTRDGYGAGAAFADVSFADDCFAGEPFQDAPIVLDLADPNLVTVRDTRPLPRGTAVADRTFADDCFANPDLGDPGTYDRLYIFDGGRVPTHLNAARAAAFADVSWVGIPPYTQILRIAVPGTPALVRQGAAFADMCCADGDACAFDAGDRTNHDFALLAIATARRAGDRVLVDLAPSFVGTRAATLPAMGDL